MQITLAESNRTINGFAAMGFAETHFTFTPGWTADPPSDASYVDARSIVIGSNAAWRLGFETPIRWRGGHGGVFAVSVHSINGILLTPISEAEHLVVLRPSNPAQYAYEGQIFYTPMLSRDSTTRYGPRLRFHTAVRIHSALGNDSAYTGTENYIESSFMAVGADIVSLPVQFRDELRSRLEQIGGLRDVRFSTVGGLWMSFRFNDAALLSLLPSFDVVVPTANGTHVQIARLDPHDYVVWNRYQYEYNINFQHDFQIRRPMMRNLLIHFDYENQRVGFGDPLADL